MRLTRCTTPKTRTIFGETINELYLYDANSNKFYGYYNNKTKMKTEYAGQYKYTWWLYIYNHQAFRISVMHLHPNSSEQD